MNIDGLSIFQQIHAVLTSAARERHTLTYSDAMTAIGWSSAHAYQRGVFAYMLRAIANMELGAGHPPLTAVIVSKDHGLPNDAFFEFVRSEGRLRQNETNDDYWARELKRVYVQWATKDSITA